MNFADATLDDLEFVADPHVYLVAGCYELPSVTHIMRRFGLGFQGYAPKSATDRGKWVHAATEVIDEGDFDWSRCPEEYEGYCRAWERAVRDLGLRFRAAEWRSFHRVYGYAGTCDRIVEPREAGDPPVVLGEIKTGDATDWQVQCAAYAELRHHWHPDEPRAEIGMLLKLNRDGTYVTEECELARPWRVFVSLLMLLDWLATTGRADAVLR